MSTDGTKPPSITPKKSGSRGPRTTSPRKPAGAKGTRSTTRSPEGSGSSNGESPDAPTGDAVTVAPVSGPVTEEAASPSVGERLKRAGQSVSDAARSAMPSGGTDQGPSTSPVAGTQQAPAGGPRRVRLAVARVDPWSVMKLAFLLSVAVGIMIVVAAAVVWYTLDGLAVFTQVNNTISEITGDPEFFDVLSYLAFDRVLALATIIAVVDIVLLTALSTIGAFLYNIVASLVGGIHVTLTDD